MTTCKDVHEFLMAYLDAELDEATRTSFDAHIDLLNGSGEFLTGSDDSTLGTSPVIFQAVQASTTNRVFYLVVSSARFDESDLAGGDEVFNLTISVDRPTFINFLNANRTFFFNSQWFFQYRTNYSKSIGPNGPWNLLGTFTMFTGFFQDRLNPRVTFVYDVQSQSGGVLPEVQYRFNEAFSLTVGAQMFWGRTQFSDIALASIGPASNQQGPNAYRNASPTGLGLFRDLDQIFMRLRYAF